MILTVILFSLLLVSIIGIGVCCYMLWRNNKVCDFRIKIIESGSLANWHQVKMLHDKYTHDQMLYSIKPLKLKYWFTEQEIKILKGGTDES